MKYITILLLAVGITAALPQQQKNIVLTLSPNEVELLYGIVDDAKLAGDVRKPLLQKIASQYQAQMQPPAPIKDTTNKNKKP